MDCCRSRYALNAVLDVEHALVSVGRYAFAV